MTPEKIDKMAEAIRFAQHPSQLRVLASELLELCALAKAAIPSGKAKDDHDLIIAHVAHECTDGATKEECRGCQMSTAADRLAAQAQSAQEWRERAVRLDAQLEARDLGLRKSIAAAEARIAELEQARTGLSEALYSQGEALAAAEERGRVLREAEAQATTHRRLAAEAQHILEMYRAAWKRELDSFYRPHRHEIDGLVASTQAMANKARREDVLSGRVANLEVALASAESRSEHWMKVAESRHAERYQWRQRAEAAEKRCAELIAAGQVLSEHVDKETEQITAEEFVAMSGDGEPYKTTVGHKATGPELLWTMRDEFAKAAMQGLLANHTTVHPPDVCAKSAYMVADSMIRARTPSAPEPAYTPFLKEYPHAFMPGAGGIDDDGCAYRHPEARTLCGYSREEHAP